METPKIMRDCLKEVLEEGSRPEHVWKDPYLLAKEFKRLEMPLHDAIAEIEKWGRHCDPIVAGSNLSSAKSAVSKVYKKDEIPLSCSPGRYLRRCDYCLLDRPGGQTCEFNNAVQTIKSFVRTKRIPEVGWLEWEKHIAVKDKGLSLYIIAFYQLLRELEEERNIPQGGMVMIGAREAVRRIKANYRDYNPGSNTLILCSRILEGHGLIIADRAKPREWVGQHRKANGYKRVLPLPAVPSNTPIL